MAEKLQHLVDIYSGSWGASASPSPAVHLGYRLVALQNFQMTTIEPPLNMSWNFLILHHLILERVFIFIQSKFQSASNQQILTEMNRTLSKVLSHCLGMKMEYDKLKNIKVSTPAIQAYNRVAYFST